MKTKRNICEIVCILLCILVASISVYLVFNSDGILLDSKEELNGMGDDMGPGALALIFVIPFIILFILAINGAIIILLLYSTVGLLCYSLYGIIRFKDDKYKSTYNFLSKAIGIVGFIFCLLWIVAVKKGNALVHLLVFCSALYIVTNAIRLSLTKKSNSNAFESKKCIN